VTTNGGLLSNSERRTLAVVCAAFMPDAAAVRLPEAVEAAMGALSVRQLRELRLFIRLLDSPLFVFAIIGRRSGISSLGSDDRERLLLALARSWVPQLRSGYQALKRLASFLFYAVLDDTGTNARWPEIGYEPLVPPPPAAPNALSLRRVTEPTTIGADVCVIGSGAAGGVVAARLASAGRHVIVLEAGSGDQAADFDQREVVGVQRLYLDQGTTSTRDVGVAILAGSCIGGGTAVNWQTSLRLPDYIRDEWSERSGLGLFADDAFIAAMDSVTERLSVSTFESVRNANNAPLERGCIALQYGWRVIPRNARGCDQSQCGYCMFGCRHGGKQSTALTYLSDAQQTGRCEIIAMCRADRIVMEQGGAVGVDATVRDEQSGSRHAVRVHARTIVVAAGALETPALLLRSGVQHSQLGKNLFLHPTSGALGRYASPVRPWIGAPQTVLCEEFARLHGNYGYRVETAPIHPGLLALAKPWYGASDHQERMRQAANTSAFVALTRDRQGGRVQIDREGRAVVEYRIGSLERRLLQLGIATAARIHHAAGADEITTLHARDYTFRRPQTSRVADIERHCRELANRPVHGNRCGVFSAHQMGTARIGADPKASVCDDHGAVRGVPGLHVADASLFPASSGVNPMLTIMALATVVAERIAQATA
jgi:choline dehydrogenase-like flavoprotein